MLMPLLALVFLRWLCSSLVVPSWKVLGRAPRSMVNSGVFSSNRAISTTWAACRCGHTNKHNVYADVITVSFPLLLGTLRRDDLKWTRRPSVRPCSAATSPEVFYSVSDGVNMQTVQKLKLGEQRKILLEKPQGCSQSLKTTQMGVPLRV